MNIQKLITSFSNSAIGAVDENFIHLLGLPSCILNSRSDQFIDSNAAFQALWQPDEPATSPSSCFYNQLPELIVFTQAISSEKATQTNDLHPTGRNGQRIPCLIHGIEIEASFGRAELLVLIPHSLIEQAQAIATVDTTWRGGLLEWRRLEVLYKEAETLNELVLKAAGDGIFGVDQDGNTTFVNPAAEETLGWSEEDLIGKSMHMLIHHHHASGEIYPASECPIYSAFRHGIVERVSSEVFWHKSGQPVPIEYTSTPIYTEGEVQGAVIIFRDISERLKNDIALRDALTEVDKLKERLQHENEYLREEVRAASNHTDIIGTSPAIQKAIEQIEIVARTDASVLITGESGTGKELVAQAIHKSSTRQENALIRVNCAAIPRELFESEFFGHVKGAFSGAISDRIGRFELANGGTLFLDEVGEIPLELQSKLLRVLQERKYERVGEGISRGTDVRIIAATNRDLRAQVRLGEFREDLFFRLDVFPIDCVPLRERPEDIPILAKHFVDIACTRLNIKRPILDADTIRELQSYSWPGNARELQNIIERGSILAQGGRLRFDHIIDSTDRQEPITAQYQLSDELSLADIAAMEKRLITETLEKCNGRVSGPFGAAKKLGLKPTTLYSKLKKLNC